MFFGGLLRLRPFVIFVGIALAAIGGWASIREISVDLLPNLDYPLINIVTRYPAGTARDTEQLLTRPIESAMRGLVNVKRIRSISAPGLSQVTVEFLWGVDSSAARQQVAGALASISPSLPAGAQPRIENVGSSLSVVSTYTLSGHASPIKMRSWADYTAAPALERLPGIVRVQVMGGGRQALRIDLDPLRMRAHGVNTRDIVKAVGEDNVLATAGSISQHGRDLLVSTKGQIRDAADLKQVLVRRGGDGSPVVLADVATIHDGAIPERYVISSDRRPAVALLVQKQQGANTLDVSAEVDKALASLPLPQGMHVRKFYDQAEIIGLAYRNMRNQLLAGAGIALLVLLLVLGRGRVTLILAATIPLSVLGVFMVMRWAGLSVNLMTLGALTVSVGMIVDDSILVLENVLRHREMGKSPVVAAMDGTREIVGADVSGTLVILAAFVPLVLLSGLAGRLFDPFAATFGGVLMLSLVLSLTLIPWAAARWLRPADDQVTRHGAISGRVLAGIVRINRGLLDRLLRHRSKTIVISLALMLGSCALLVFNPIRFLPLLDEDSLLLSYQLAPGTSLEESNRIGDSLEALALHEPGIAAVFRRTGSPGNSYYLEGPDAGELVLRLRKDGRRTASDIRQALTAKLAKMPGLLTRINEPTSEKIDESLSGLPAVFGITVLGNDLAGLHRAANLVETAARNVPGIDNVVNNNRIPLDGLDIEIDRVACARLGVSPRAVAQAARLAVQGQQLGESIVDGKLLPFYARYANASRLQPSGLDDILIPAANGAQVPLGQLAHVVAGSHYPTIEHQFGSRALTLGIDIAGNPVSVIGALNQSIAKLHLPEGVRVVYSGEYRELLHTAGQLALILLASGLLVYGIMVVQFGNLLDPAVILLKLPIDAMGAAFALFITRQEVDMTVMIGLVTLIGVSVNNGIVLLSFVQALRAKGYSAVDAVHEAVAVRLRPMLLTQLTAVIGMLPAAVGWGNGPQLLQPLAIMLFGGLTVGAFLTLNLIPVFYVATERFRRAIVPG